MFQSNALSTPIAFHAGADFCELFYEYRHCQKFSLSKMRNIFFASKLALFILFIAAQVACAPVGTRKATGGLLIRCPSPKEANMLDVNEGVIELRRSPARSDPKCNTSSKSNSSDPLPAI